ncbi:hypothetical protein OGAPHI_003479 [Ogataea philodendri]|uniref:1,3-beta-glucanosyltransferase n=1 Tax=Ogataea philodendri TaxID=1378263 RepID=A0A9P8T4Z9_9ASCO|nr:uncharacterized protein OGAPHI_003479 [Ogataea philodendri]KAH3666483.1 hypothetical protein OGAPHI_003479 [Ogataea philodendri]
MEQLAYAPATSRSVSESLIRRAKQSLDHEIPLYTSNKQRDHYESIAELYSIIVAINVLEKSFIKDRFHANEDYYTSTTMRLINQYNLILKDDEVKEEFDDLEKFVSRYQLDCPLAVKRIQIGLPATATQTHASSSTVNLPASANNNDASQKGKAIAEATGSFITLMDAIKLNYNTKEQLHPLLTDIITSTNKVFGDYDGRSNLVQWLIKLNNLKLNEFLDDEELKEFLWDIDLAYKGFFSLLGILSSLSAVNALIPIEVVGNRFIKPAVDASDPGEVFFVTGVDYQPGGSSDYQDSNPTDVLSDIEACYRDAYVLQSLGSEVNVIRVYTLNPDLNHDECMSVLNAAGIYVIIDVNSPLSGESLDRYNPSNSYTYSYMERVFKMIDAFKNYPNLLGFFSGNEVINDSKSAGVDPKYLRAVQRDMKRYIENNSNRTIPVGYSAADVLDDGLRDVTLEYLICSIDGEKDDYSKSDFFGINSYEWCSGVSDWSSSGYGSLNKTISNSTVPVFFSEYGCIAKTPRTFTEVSEGVYGGLVNTLSGGLIYEYSVEANNYGIVEIDDDGSLTYKEDFDNLKSQFANSSIPDISSDDVSEAKIVTCDKEYLESLSSVFDVDFDLPDAPDGVEDLILYGVNGSNIGQIVDIDIRASNYTIHDADDNEVTSAVISVASTNTINAQTGVSSSGSSKQTSTVDSSSSSATSSVSRTSSSSKGDANQNLKYAVIPVPTIVQKEILPVVPWWALVSFGCYALGTLGWGVYTFKDKKDKYTELLGEIKEAESYLRKNGVDIDS